MDGDAELLGVLVAAVNLPEANPGFTTKQVDAHPLDGADVNERITQFGIGQQRVRPHGWIELLALIKVGLLETLRIHRVELVELKTGLGLEAGEGAHRLRGKCAAIDQE